MIKGLAQKIYDIPNGFWFLAFAIALICAQLVALAWLADGQVQKASARDRVASENGVALAQCFEHKSAERMSQCASGGAVARAATTETTMSAEQFIAQYTGSSNAGGNSGRVQSGVRQVAFVR